MRHPKHILHHHNLSPKKSLGQNFLFDENVLAQIAKTAILQPTDTVLEIGPGLGALTQVIAPQVSRVVAIELDDRLLPILDNVLADYANVDVVHNDILKIKPRDWFDQPYKVVANVPYYITGAILRHLLQATSKPTMMVMTVQKEVANRITAVPPHMSLLAVSVQLYGRITLSHTIKAGAFWPRPAVDSAVIRIDIVEPQKQLDEKTFFRVVKAGFSQKRKQLKNNLRSLGLSATEVTALLTQADIDGRRRPQTLTVTEWLAIVAAFPHQVSR